MNTCKTTPVILSELRDEGYSPELLVEVRKNMEAIRNKKTNRTLEQTYKMYDYTKRDTSGFLSIGLGLTTGNKYVQDVSRNLYQTLMDSTQASQRLSKKNKEFRRKYTTYNDSLDYVEDFWEHNRFINQMKAYLGVGNDKFNRLNLNDFLSTAMRAFAKRNQRDSSEIAKIEAAINKDFADVIKFNEPGSEQRKKELYKKLDLIFGQSAIFNLGAFDVNYLQKIENSTDKNILNFLIDEVNITTSKDNDINKIGEYLGKLYINGEDLNSTVSDKHKYMSPSHAYKEGTNEHIQVSILSALYALKEIPGSVDMIRDMYKNKKDSYGLLVSGAFGMANETNAIYRHHARYSKNMQMGNFVKEIYEEQYDTMLINEADFNKNRFSKENGWKVLRQPSKGNVGIAYRESTGKYQPGAGINVSFIKNGIVTTSLPKGINKTGKGVYSFKKVDNISETEKKIRKSTLNERNDDVYVVTLTNEEKDTLSRLYNPAHSLMRTSGHNKEILDTRKIRDMMVTEVFTYEVSDEDSINELYDIIMDKDRENPWHLNTNLVQRSALSKEAQDKYDRITKKYMAAKGITNIDELKDKINLTRKDLASIIDGYDENMFAKDRHGFNKAVEVIKKIVSYTKIQQIILSPAKIAADFSSGVSLLMTLGLDAKEIWDSFRSTVVEMKDLTEKRNRMVGLEFMVMAEGKNLDESNADYEKNKTKTQRELDKVVREIRDHKMAPALFNGLLQSISTDITLKNYETISGLDKDIKDIISKVARNKKTGELNALGSSIMKAANYGVDLTEVMRRIGEFSGKLDSTKTIEESFHTFADNVSRAKNENDVETYISEFIGSPGSEIVKLGSALTQWSDILPRVALYQHLKGKGKTEEEAIIESLDNFIDYKMNMPPEIKFFSDTFFLMYPSFWMKIQKVIFNLGKNHPASLGAALLLTEVLDLGQLHILESSVFNKYGSGSLWDVPEARDLTFFWFNLA